MVSANPTGPLTVASARNGAYGDAVARLLELRGARRSSASTTTTTRAARWTASAPRSRRAGAARSRPRTAIAAPTSRTSPRLAGDPVPQMLRADRGVARALPDPLRLVARAERARAAAARAPAALLDTYERDGALWARSSAYGDDEDRVAAALRGRHADLPRRRRRLPRRQARARLRPRDLRPRRRPPRHAELVRGDRADARLRPRAGRGAALPARQPHPGRARRRGCRKRRGDVVFLDDFIDEIGVDAARWYLVNRGPDQTIEIDVDLAAERSQKNPVYYVQYAHARIAGILRNAGGAAVGGEPAAALAAEERELVKRLAELPGVVTERCREARPAGDPGLRDPARRRLPSLLPRASRARERAGVLPARALPRHAVRDRALPRPRRGRGARPHVTRRSRRRS